MLSWIPLVGPILEGLFNTVSSIYSKFKDTQVEMRQADVDEAKVSQQIIETTNDDIALRILRDMAITPVVVWSMLIGWDTIIAVRFPDLMFHVPNYPDSVSYLPYAVIVFLFGNIGLNIWKRK